MKPYINYHRLSFYLIIFFLIFSCEKEEIIEEKSAIEQEELIVTKLNVNASAVHSSGSTSTKTKFYFADVTGDGRADKIYHKYDKYGGDIRVFTATGGGNFSTSAVHSSGSTSTQTKFYFADVTGDSRADKIYWKYNNYGGKIRMFNSTGGGNFSTLASESTGSTNSNTKFYFAYINSDNKMDKIRWTISGFNGPLEVFYAGLLGTYPNFPSTTDIGSYSTFTEFYFENIGGSLSNDTKIYWNYNKYGGDIRYFINSNGNFVTPITGPGSSSNKTVHYFADVTGDGRADRIYWKYDKYGGDIRVFPN